MTREAGRIIPRRDRLTAAIAGVALAVLTAATFLDVFSLPRLAFEYQITMNRE